MTCGESANDSSVQWKVQLLGESKQHFVANKNKIYQEFSEFRVVADGRFRLITAEAQVKHGGTYFCIRITGHRTKTYSAMLTVLGRITALIGICIFYLVRTYPIGESQQPIKTNVKLVSYMFKLVNRKVAKSSLS